MASLVIIGLVTVRPLDCSKHRAVTPIGAVWRSRVETKARRCNCWWSTANQHMKQYITFFLAASSTIGFRERSDFFITPDPEGLVVLEGLSIILDPEMSSDSGAKIQPKTFPSLGRRPNAVLEPWNTGHDGSPERRTRHSPAVSAYLPNKCRARSGSCFTKSCETVNFISRCTSWRGDLGADWAEPTTPRMLISSFPSRN